MRRLAYVMGATTWLAGCMSTEFSYSEDRAGAEPNDSAPSDQGESDLDDDGWESEAEDDFLALEPSQTDVYVFIANPARGSVTRVNVYTQAVDTTPVGLDPQVVITDPDYAYAAVFNRGDDSVSLIDAVTLEQRVVPVRDNFNNMVMSADGNWLALWHDVAAERPDDPEPEGLQSYNEASFVRVSDGAHFPMAVGFNPREIRFTDDGTTALVVSDETLALVDLRADPERPDVIELDPDTLEPPRAEEVVISPSGTYAYVRQFGASELLVVDLDLKVVERLEIGDNPTDLDLSPDGSLAVAVARSSRELWVFDPEAPFSTVDVVALPDDENFGSILFDPIGEQAILYTTAGTSNHYAAWDLNANTIRVHDVVKPIAGMTITPTGESMMVFHKLEDAPGADPDSPFFGEWALSLVDLRDFRSNPLKLPAEPTGYANSNNGRLGYFIMEGQPFLEVIDYVSLLYTEVRLRSNPVYVGVLPDLDPTDGDEPVAWASQEHELGRITFFDPDGGEDGEGTAETITGFELNSQIED